MSKFPPGTLVKVTDPESEYYGQVGQVFSDYRSGMERQAYGVHFDDGREFWVYETNLEAVEPKAKQ